MAMLIGSDGQRLMAPSVNWDHGRAFADLVRMPDRLYDQDIVAWSDRQAALVRRLGRSERANGIDRAHVVEQIGDVGLSELSAVRSHLRRMLVHLLKVTPGPIICPWRTGGRRLPHARLKRRKGFAPSMR